MTTFTDISDEVLEPGKPIRSVDVLALRDNTKYNHENTVLEILREDTFTTSGTWTKATGYDADDTVMIFLIGGGGSGAVNTASGGTDNVATGGTGGCCAIFTRRYADVSGSYAFTLGAGALGVSRTNNRVNGNNGSNSTFSSGTVNIASANGGVGGVQGVATGAQATSFSPILNNALIYTYDIAPVLAVASEYQIYSSVGTNAVQSRTERDPNQRKPIACGFGGNAAIGNIGGLSIYNPPIDGFLFANSSAGSHTTDSANANFGGGSGGVVSLGGTGTTGNGGNGALVVRYYRGRVAVEQVIFAGI
jgi:hypothetical protein